MIVLEVRIVVTLGEEVEGSWLGESRGRGFPDTAYVLVPDLVVIIRVCSCRDNSSSSVQMMCFSVSYISIKFI